MAKISTPRADSSSEPTPNPLERDRLTRRERAVWRAALVLLAVLALALAITSWDGIRAMPHHLEALPVGLVVLVTLFVSYAWTKTNEIAELRGLVRGIEQRSQAEQDAAQLDQVFSLISKSQQGYRDLIDTFEDLLFSLSASGNVLTVNRSFADLLKLPFAELIGHPIDEFLELLDSGDRVALEQWVPQLLDRRRWNGVVRVRVKKTGAIHYFDCILHAVVRGDDVQGVRGVRSEARRERQNETRFTELFRSEEHTSELQS